MIALLTHIIPMGMGVLLRIWNEHQKQKAMDHKMQMALLSKKTEILDMQHERVAASTFLQTMMMMLVTAALGVLIAFPIFAVLLDVPLVTLHEYVMKSGFWIFATEKTVHEWKEITGLYLPEQFSMVIVAAIEFCFGAIIGGVGRR